MLLFFEPIVKTIIFIYIVFMNRRMGSSFKYNLKVNFNYVSLNI